MMESPALERGKELLNIPMSKLPAPAMGYMKYLSRKVGMCIEVCLTAYTAYAQICEGLECTEIDYQASPDAINWFNENR